MQCYMYSCLWFLLMLILILQLLQIFIERKFCVIMMTTTVVATKVQNSPRTKSVSTKKVSHPASPTIICPHCERLAMFPMYVVKTLLSHKTFIALCVLLQTINFGCSSCCEHIGNCGILWNFFVSLFLRLTFFYAL